VRACCVLAFAGHAQDHSAQAETWARRAIDHHAALGLSPDPRPHILLAYGLAYQGRVEEAVAAIGVALEAAAAVGDDAHYDRVEALYQLGFVGMLRGAPDVALGEELLSLARSLGNTWLLGRACLTLGLLLLPEDRPRALGLIRETIEVSLRPAVPYWVGSALVFLAAGIAETDPAAGLRRLADTLEQLRLMGAQPWVRRSLRVFMVPFAALGRDEAVALIDGASNPASNWPGAVARARDEARARLGATRYDELRTDAERVPDNLLLERLVQHIDGALEASPAGTASA
jgi:hypothetical protein